MVELLDTTLRDGEQTVRVSFNVNEKLTIAHMLLNKLKVDRIEVASARVSMGENEAFKHICAWAEKHNQLQKIEALGFIDGGVSVKWIADSGGKVINILAKGSLRHLSKQLGKTPSEHLSDIEKVLQVADDNHMTANIYLEDWSNGMISSRDYVYEMVSHLTEFPIERIMLPDTLGVLNPWTTYEFCRDMHEKWPQARFDFHAHNDYGLAVANSLEAIKAGVSGVHTTINGLGERSGNAPTSSVVAAIKDLTGEKISVDETQLMRVCRCVESITGIRIPANEPIVGDNVFTQSSGIHADGDCKDNLYANALLPQRFGRERTYALGKMSGKSNIIKNLDKLGISLTPEQIRIVTNRIVELGDRKEAIEAEDLPYIIADVLKTERTGGDDHIRIINYSLQLTRGMRPVAQLKLGIRDKEFQASAEGDGQYNAFMKALWKIYDKLKKPHPELLDFQASIPPGGKTDALVLVTIVWNFKGHEFKTHGLDPDITEAAIKSTLKMLNIIENTYN